MDNDLDILYITETFLNEKGDEVQIGELKPMGYDHKQTPRHAKNHGGGIMAIYKKHIQLKKESQPTVTSPCK